MAGVGIVERFGFGHGSWGKDLLRRRRRGFNGKSVRDSAQSLVHRFERLRKDPGFGDDRHEIRIAVPAWNDVRMKMGDAAAGSRAEIEAQVECVGFERSAEDVLARDYLVHQVGPFAGIEVGEVGDVPERYGQKMAGIVGIAIEDEIRKRAAMYDERRRIVT